MALSQNDIDKVTAAMKKARSFDTYDSLPNVAVRVGNILKAEVKLKYMVPILVTLGVLGGGVAYRHSDAEAGQGNRLGIVESKIAVAETQIKDLQEHVRLIAIEVRSLHAANLEQWKYQAERQRDAERAKELESQIEDLKKTGLK